MNAFPPITTPPISRVTSFTAPASSDSAVEAELEQLLLALGMPICSGCGLPLDGKRGNTEDRYYDELTRPSSAAEPFRCCGIAHCPFCGLAASARCRHRVAWKQYGVWRIPGVGLCQNSIAPDHGLPDSLLIDFDEDQKQEAWGSSACLLEPLYGVGFRHDPATQQRLIAAVAENVLGNSPAEPGQHTSNCASAFPATGEIRVIRARYYDRYQQYHFARDPDAARARARQALKDLAAGPERIKSMMPRAATRHLRHEIVLPDTAGPVSCLVFSPDSRWLLVGAKGEALLYDIAEGSGTLRHRLRAPGWSAPGHRIEPEQGSGISWKYDRIWASFSPDGERVTVTGIEPPSTWPWLRACRPHTGPTAIFDTATGRKITELGRTMGATQDASTNVPSPGDAPAALVAGGHILAQAQGRMLHLTAVDARGKTLLGEQDAVRLPHRASIRHLAFASNGSVFATSQDDSPNSSLARSRVLVWNVLPVSDLQ